MRETQNCRALKSQMLGKGAGKPSKILPPNSLSAQFVPTAQNFASDLNKTRNQLNTLMIQNVLSEPQWLERMQAEDMRALTPLVWKHMTPYGRFSLNFKERLALDSTHQILTA